MLDKIARYFNFYRQATTVHHMHSPFVFDFVQNVLDDKKRYYIFNALEHERRILLSNKNKITLTDYGAGSKTGQGREKSIGAIASGVMSNKKKCHILFNLVNAFQPGTVIELGTSLGLSTMYMAKANEKSVVYTIEADPAIYKLARLLFERNNVPNIHLINDTFVNVLPDLLKKVEKVDLAYIDGNHSYEATINHFNLLLNRCHSKSIFVFDDIYWSDQMLKAWEEIKNKQEVAFTIDTFDFGFVFFDNMMPKQHFKYIEFFKKPFHIGLWP